VAVVVVAAANLVQDDPITITQAQQEPHKVPQDKAKVPVTELVAVVAVVAKTAAPVDLLLVVTMVLSVAKMAIVWLQEEAQFRVVPKQAAELLTQPDLQVPLQLASFHKLLRCQH
jgi:hypothetical protein